MNDLNTQLTIKESIRDDLKKALPGLTHDDRLRVLLNVFRKTKGSVRAKSVDEVVTSDRSRPDVAAIARAGSPVPPPTVPPAAAALMPRATAATSKTYSPAGRAITRPRVGSAFDVSG